MEYCIKGAGEMLESIASRGSAADSDASDDEHGLFTSAEGPPPYTRRRSR
jgi:hypothetical protein